MSHFYLLGMLNVMFAHLLATLVTTARRTDSRAALTERAEDVSRRVIVRSKHNARNQ
jgi:hypothetical protein